MKRILFILISIIIPLNFVFADKSELDKAYQEMFEAIVHKNSEKLINAIERGKQIPGFDINYTSRVGDTFLHEAVAFRFSDGVKILVRANANVNLKNDLGFSPIYFAVGMPEEKSEDMPPISRGNLSSLRALLESNLLVLDDVTLDRATNVFIQLPNCQDVTSIAQQKRNEQLLVIMELVVRGFTSKSSVTNRRLAMILSNLSQLYTPSSSSNNGYDDIFANMMEWRTSKRHLLDLAAFVRSQVRVMTEEKRNQLIARITSKLESIKEKRK